MLGEIDDDLSAFLDIDLIGIGGNKDMFGITNGNCSWKPFNTPWGQKVLVPEDFNTTRDNDGNIYVYPEGDTSIPPSAKLLSSGYFFDAIIRQQPIDDTNLNPEDNLEEFGLWNESTLEYWKTAINNAPNELGLVVNPGGTAIGDIDTQKVLSFAKPEEVRAEILRNCEIFSKDGGFVFNTVHNTQADVPIENLEAMVKALQEIRT